MIVRIVRRSQSMKTNRLFIENKVNLKMNKSTRMEELSLSQIFSLEPSSE